MPTTPRPEAPRPCHRGASRRRPLPRLRKILAVPREGTEGDRRRPEGLISLNTPYWRRREVSAKEGALYFGAGSQVMKRTYVSFAPLSLVYMFPASAPWDGIGPVELKARMQGEDRASTSARPDRGRSRSGGSATRRRRAARRSRASSSSQGRRGPSRSRLGRSRGRVAGPFSSSPAQGIGGRHAAEPGHGPHRLPGAAREGGRRPRRSRRASSATVVAEEPACLGITIHQDVSDPTRILLHEEWVDKASYVGRTCRRRTSGPSSRGRRSSSPGRPTSPSGSGGAKRGAAEGRPLPRRRVSCRIRA